MRRGLRALLVAVALAMLIVSGVVAVDTRTAVLAREVKCMQVSYGGGITRCFDARDVRLVDAALPFHVVDPASAVERVLHLPLTEVSLATAGGPTGGLQRPVTSISYMFGTIPGGGDIPMPSPAHPRFAVISEGIGGGPSPSVVDRAQGVTCDRHDNCHRVVGDWTYWGTIRRSGIGLRVEANASEAAVLAVGRMIGS